MEITGRIKLIGPVQEVSPTFRKRELVVTTEEQYPQTLMIEFVQDKSDLLNGYQPGEMVRVSINLRGREWQNPQGEMKYFTSLSGWRIDRPQPQGGYQAPNQGYGNAAPTQGYGNPPQNQGFPPAPQFTQTEDPDDLPF